MCGMPLVWLCDSIRHACNHFDLGPCHQLTILVNVHVAVWLLMDQLAMMQGSVMASDAFFPFAWNDSVEMACKAGVKAIAHPGGSMRDQDAIDCCNKYGVALVTTGVRHFRH